MQRIDLLDTSLSKIKNRDLILKEFTKPIFENIFFINKQLLILNSTIFEFNTNTWIQNPQAYCLAKYGQIEFYKIILLINNIGSIVQFKPDNLKKIITPKEHFISKLIGQRL